MVGLALAVALAEAGLEVMVVDRMDPARQREEAFDGRASAIARGSRQALEVLGLWAGMAPAAAPILDIRISDGRAYETGLGRRRPGGRSEEHTSELQSLMRLPYAVIFLKKKKKRE